jgi:hypothetical protein
MTNVRRILKKLGHSIASAEEARDILVPKGSDFAVFRTVTDLGGSCTPALQGDLLISRRALSKVRMSRHLPRGSRRKERVEFARLRKAKRHHGNASRRQGRDHNRSKRGAGRCDGEAVRPSRESNSDGSAALTSASMICAPSEAHPSCARITPGSVCMTIELLPPWLADRGDAAQTADSASGRCIST